VLTELLAASRELADEVGEVAVVGVAAVGVAAGGRAQGGDDVAGDAVPVEVELAGSVCTMSYSCSALAAALSTNAATIDTLSSSLGSSITRHMMTDRATAGATA